MADVSISIGVLISLSIPLLLTFISIQIAMSNRLTKLETRGQIKEQVIKDELDDLSDTLGMHSKMLSEILLKLENKQNKA